MVELLLPQKKIFKKLKWINNSKMEKRVLEKELNEYIKSGWSLGRIEKECPFCNRKYSPMNYSKHIKKCRDN
jgi:hypothetical protein